MISEKLQLALFNFLGSTRDGKPTDEETQERIIYKKKDDTLLLITSQKKADCSFAIGLSPQPPMLGRSELAVIERGIMPLAGKQTLMGSAFDHIAVFHV